MLNQRSMNAESSAVLHHLLNLCESDPRGYARIDNDDSYLPVTVEKLRTPKKEMKIVSVCHYGKLDCDLARDPEMLFLVTPNKCLPFYYRNDYAGYENQIADYLGGNFELDPMGVAQFNSMKEFAEEWMASIKVQQQLDVSPTNNQNHV